MKAEHIIRKIRDNIPLHKPSKVPGLTYEQGADEALSWVLDELDEENNFEGQFR